MGTKYFKIIFIVFLMFFLNGCNILYEYELNTVTTYEVKINDIAEMKERYCLICFHRGGSYASDGIFVKNIKCWYNQDTISKRLFNSKELKQIKKQILSDNTVSKIYPYIEIYKGIYQGSCSGIKKLNCNFYSFVAISNGNAIIFPVIKLDDTIYINGINNKLITEEKIQYIENKLMQQFDSISVKEAVKEFSEGRKKKQRIKNCGRFV